MAKSGFASVNDYMLAQPPTVRPILRKVRAILRKALPKAEECISYQIPAFRMPGGMVIYFAGWKQHYSVYPATELVVTTLSKQLAGYKLSKGTIRFPLTEPVPEKLVARIAKLRAKEVAERAKKKKSKVL